jgi:response regulator RpfG family c-di-GMP phosphodiesterase
MQDKSLRALLIDDSEDDVLLIIRELKKGGYNPIYERIETAAAMKKSLQEKQWDVILCDYKMPNFSAPSAIDLFKESNIDIPFIVISGAIGEETAIECMRLGAHDYFVKGKLSRLCPAIARELEDAKIRIKQKLAEEELHKTLESLKKAVGTTIQILVSALESRDPYTAGHQSQSANLACSIAREMGLSRDKIEGIRMAGSINDIGKLSIPAEILIKPTRLTDIEFSLIKEHPQSGYEMLKDVESPWPLAQIVYQHHERMNGTGYPRNLKGDEIILEARIMAVADVVDAMASHRPYRALLGMDMALKEIENNKGILYDTAVVEACLKLIREKGYQLALRWENQFIS